MNKLLPEEREKWHHLLSEKLGDGYDFDLINKKLDECEKGWGHAPKTMEDRIQAKFFKKPPWGSPPDVIPSAAEGSPCVA